MTPCTEQNRLERIESKLDNIDAKLDKYLEKTVQTETKVGFITTGFIVLIAPIIVGFVIYLLTN